MLGYTWVVFEKFSVLLSRDGYLSSTKFLYFSHEMGTFFQETFCIFCARWVLFVGIFWCVLQKVGAIYAEIFCIFQQGGYLKKDFFCILVSKWVVSLSLISLFRPFL